MVGVHSFKLTVWAGVLELGHGAWRHEMGMGDGDGERVLLRVQGPLSVSLSAAVQLSLMRPALSARVSSTRHARAKAVIIGL